MFPVLMTTPPADEAMIARAPVLRARRVRARVLCQRGRAAVPAATAVHSTVLYSRSTDGTDTRARR